MKKMEKKQSLADPCVFYKLDANDELLLMVSVTVNDCAVTGLPNDIKWFITNLETSRNRLRMGSFTEWQSFCESDNG